MADNSQAMRLDKWLVYARIARTRSRAQKLIAEGKVRANRVKVTTPGKTVRPGDTLTLNLPRAVCVYRIEALATRRGSYEDARQLYSDLTGPTPVRGPDDRERHRRPDKRQRRALAALRGKFDA